MASGVMGSFAEKTGIPFLIAILVITLSGLGVPAFRRSGSGRGGLTSPHDALWRTAACDLFLDEKRPNADRKPPLKLYPTQREAPLED